MVKNTSKVIQRIVQDLSSTKYCYLSTIKNGVLDYCLHNKIYLTEKEKDYCVSQIALLIQKIYAN